MATVTLTTGSYGMGDDTTEEEYDAWIEFRDGLLHLEEIAQGLFDAETGEDRT